MIKCVSRSPAEFFDSTTTGKNLIFNLGVIINRFTNDLGTLS